MNYISSPIRYPRWITLTFAIGTVALAGWVYLVAKINWWESDLLAYYGAGRAIAEGQAARLYDAELFRAWQTSWIGPPEHYPVYLFLYAPLFAAGYLPFAALPLGVARWSWLVLGMVLLACACRLSRQWSSLDGPRTIVALLSFAPVPIAFLAGQVSPLTLALYTAIAGLEWRNKSGFLAGSLAGWLLYKPQLVVVLLIFWLYRRRWRELAGFCTTATVIGAGSLVVSAAATRTYIFSGPTLLRLMQTGVGRTGVNVTIFATAGPLVGGFVALVVLGLLLLAWKRSDSPTRYHHAMLWLAPLLVTPYLVRYDVLLLALPLSFLVTTLSHDWLLRWVVALAWIAQFSLIFKWTSPFMACSVLILYAYCAWRAFGNLPHRRCSHQFLVIDRPSTDGVKRNAPGSNERL